MKSTARTFLPLYGALILVSILIGFSVSDGTPSGLMSGIFSLIYGILLVAVIVVTTVVIIQRFYKNLLCDEGYLMFTLPVSTANLVTSKLLAAMIWQILSVIAGAISIFFIMLISTIPFNFGELVIALKDGILYMNQNSPINIWLVSFEFILLMLASAAAGTQLIYASLSLGHLYGKRPILASVTAYIGICIIMNFAGGILAKVVDLVTEGNHMFWTKFSNSPEAIYYALGLGILITAVTFAIGYAVSALVLKKKLNLA